MNRELDRQMTSDEDLFQLCQEGNLDAFRVLIGQRYLKHIYETCYNSFDQDTDLAGEFFDYVMMRLEKNCRRHGFFPEFAATDDFHTRFKSTLWHYMQQFYKPDFLTERNKLTVKTLSLDRDSNAVKTSLVGDSIEDSPDDQLQIDIPSELNKKILFELIYRYGIYPLTKIDSHALAKVVGHNEKKMVQIIKEALEEEGQNKAEIRQEAKEKLEPLNVELMKLSNELNPDPHNDPEEEVIRVNAAEKRYRRLAGKRRDLREKIVKQDLISTKTVCKLLNMSEEQCYKMKYELKAKLKDDYSKRAKRKD